MSSLSQPSAPSTTSPKHRWTPLRLSALLIGLVLLIILLSLAWWMFSPLFFHISSHEPNPFTSDSSTGSVPGARILATGAFIDNPHSNVGLAHDHGTGQVTIGQTAHGEYLIHFDRLNVTNGPDLHVYLAPTSTSTNAGQVKLQGVDLGTLRATEGSLNVPIPTETAMNLSRYHSVVIVCKTFSVIFTTAPLTFSSGSSR